jgi:hypothetical protein
MEVIHAFANQEELATSYMRRVISAGDLKTRVGRSNTGEIEPGQTVLWLDGRKVSTHGHRIILVGKFMPSGKKEKGARV